MRKRTKIWLGIGAVLLIGFATGFHGNSTATTTPPAATASPATSKPAVTPDSLPAQNTAAPAATVTPKPTATPVPVATPTPTPQPVIVTPAPTPAKPTLTVADHDYMNKLIDHQQRFTDTLKQFAQLSSKFNPADTNWVIDVAVNLQTMKSLADEGIAITPTPIYAGVHSEYVQAMNDYKTVATELPSAIDKSDMNKINQLTVTMGNGSKHMQNATVKAQEVQKQLQ